MKERQFAKLFETPTTQVLIFYGRTEDQSAPKIYRWIHVSGAEVGAHLEWTDDSEKSFAAADSAFDKHDQAEAEKIVASIHRMLDT